MVPDFRNVEDHTFVDLRAKATREEWASETLEDVIDSWVNGRRKRYSRAINSGLCNLSLLLLCPTNCSCCSYCKRIRGTELLGTFIVT